MNLASQYVVTPFLAHHAEPLHSAVTSSVPHLSPWLPWCNDDYSLKDAQAWVASSRQEWRADQDYRFLIEHIKSGRIAGSVAVRKTGSLPKTGNLGYWVAVSDLGLGITAWAAQQVLHFAFDKLGFRRIEIIVLPDNHASNAVARKLGATFEGLKRNAIAISNQLLDSNCYSVIPTDFGVANDASIHLQAHFATPTS